MRRVVSMKLISIANTPGMRQSEALAALCGRLDIPDGVVRAIFALPR